MARGGARKRPFYRIQVADCRCPRDGRYIERIGHYDPLADGEGNLSLDMGRVAHWMERGAIPSQTVKELMHRLENPEQAAKKRKAKEAVKREKLRVAAKAAKMAAKAQEAEKEEAAAEPEPVVAVEAEAKTAAAEPAEAETKAEVAAEPEHPEKS